MNELGICRHVCLMVTSSAFLFRDRSFFMREEGGLVGFGGGGPLEKNWLERGGQPKKMKERGGGVGRKKLD